MRMMGLPEIVVILAVIGFVVWPFWRIFRRVGLPGPLALLMLLPVVNVVMLFVLAFAPWPLEQRAHAAGTTGAPRLPS